MVTYRIGRNQSVNDKLPKLPARNVNASHCDPSGVSTALTRFKLKHRANLLWV